MTYSNEFQLPSKIFLYNEPSTKNLKLNEIASYIEEKTGLITELRKSFFQHHKPKDVADVAKRLAASKVRSLDKIEEFEPLLGEVHVEKRLLTDPDFSLPGILYDGFRMHSVYQHMIPEEEKKLDYAHMIFTNRLFATFDQNDKRYHARVIICGYPSIISTSGIVEAPAKPKGFYVAKQKLGSLGLEAIDALKEEYKGEFMDYDDERLTEVMKGYAMQAFFYHVINDPFCDSKQCRLFNAHWQSEVIEAQLKDDKYCERHRKMLEKVKHGAKNR